MVYRNEVCLTGFLINLAACVKVDLMPNDDISATLTTESSSSNGASNEQVTVFTVLDTTTIVSVQEITISRIIPGLSGVKVSYTTTDGQIKETDSQIVVSKFPAKALCIP